MNDGIRDTTGFSEDTSRRLLDVLQAELGGDNQKIESCLWGLWMAASIASSHEGVADPKLLKAKYQKVLASIRNLEQSLREFGPPEIETLSDLIEGYGADEVLSKFDCYGVPSDMQGVYGVTVYETRRQLQILARAIEHALNRIRVPRGARPKLRQKYLAYFVAEELRDRDIVPSAYDDGIYFRVLEILFQECFGDDDSERHRRHGADALKGFPDDHDIKYLPPGALDT